MGSRNGAFTASYLTLSLSEFSDRVKRARDLLSRCTLCPRNCSVDRTAGEKGFCNTGDKPHVASWGPHFGEERPLVGRFGSGTIFFSRCNLGCVFCQNWSISHQGEGEALSHKRLAGIMLELQSMGCHNINLVTPTHQLTMILQALFIAREEGLTLPIVYNCGGYESLETLDMLNGIIDIYMPDFKYADPVMALQYSMVENYPQAAKAAIREMHRQVGDLAIDCQGIAQRGLLVRHLVLPGGIANTGEIVRFIAEEISRNTYINIMNQYHPCFRASEFPPINRRITGSEYTEALQAASAAGLRRVDGVSA